MESQSIWLWWLAFHILHNFLEINESFCMYQYFILFLWPNIFTWYRRIPMNSFLSFFFLFLRLPHHFTEQLNYFTFPLIIYEWSSSPHLLQCFCVVIDFSFSASCRCVEITHCGYNLHLPSGCNVKHIFICLFAICIFSVHEISICVFCSFLIRFAYFAF